jgi:4-alpha-glucanotransferase
MRHDSHDRYFREPFGAAETGGPVRLRLAIDRNLPVSSVQCVVWQDKAGREDRHGMEPAGEDGAWRVYEASIAVPDVPQLLWYHFRIETPEKTLYYGKRDHGFGGEGEVRESPPPAWQITVYERGSSVPAWFRDRIMYQIFVDRFCNGNPDGRVTGLGPGSVIHAHWSDRPLYIKNEQGDVICWDFFGGNLAGVRKKLGYLRSLGVGVIYLNPVFESPSNHKYDTADYHRIDPMFGDNGQFEELCRTAEEMGIRIVLDGVFSHTGSDSLYFNKEGRYPTLGAYQSPESPYYRWFRFEEYPDRYACWWGVKVMPKVNELEPSYQDFVIRGENSVVAFWHAKGIAGWRLDVVDELDGEFVKQFRARLKELNPEAVLIGEVWEDASNKISYGKRRDYLLGRELDSVMNYPFRSIAADFVLGRADARRTHLALMTLAEHYPLHHFYSMMNLIGSHDVPRILTVMREGLPDGLPDRERKRLAVARVKLLILWQMTFPGVPSVYYGDEAGVEGGADPDNRATYPWGRENRELLDWTREMAALRGAYDVFRTGSWTSLVLDDSVYGYVRTIRDGRDVFGEPREDNAALVVLNRDPLRTVHLSIPAAEWFASGAYDVLADEEVAVTDDGALRVTLGPLEGKVLLRRRWPGGAGGRGGGALAADRSVASMPSAAESPIAAWPSAAESPIAAWPSAASLTDALSSIASPSAGHSTASPSSHAAGGHGLGHAVFDRRSSGILLPVTALPSPFGIGDFGEAAYRFVDFLADAGQTWWQMLPIHPFGLGNSPYLSASAFAGSSLLIDPAALVADGLLDEADPVDRPAFREDRVEYGRVAAWKDGVLRRAFANFRRREAPADYRAFLDEERWWLDDYALFEALRRHFRGRKWHEWPKSLARRDPAALTRYRERLADEIAYQMFVQYLFFRQWRRLKAYAAGRGVRIIGDIPLFVGHDSCDVWANAHLFELDEAGLPRRVAGVPPDDFSAEGQRWGSPLYDWAKMKEDGYDWWKKRLGHLFGMMDLVRLDHFRGFEAYWAIPAEEPTAVNGKWEPGPGEDFFIELERTFGKLPVFAEDLGIITPEVEELKWRFAFPGTKVWQFLASPHGGKYRFPLREANNVLYTGTHDNDTALGWLRTARPDLDGAEAEAAVWELIGAVYRTHAKIVIVPLQDCLCLGSEARFNVPGTPEGNWEWRTPEDAFGPELARRLAALANACERGNGR